MTDRTILGMACDTLEQIKTYSNSNLVRIYNDVAVNPVKKFSTRADAIRRTAKALGLTVDEQPVAAARSAKPKQAKQEKGSKPKQAKESKPNRQDMTISVLFKENPRPKNTNSHKRLSKLETGMTVASFLKCGGSMITIGHAVKKGWINLS